MFSKKLNQLLLIWTLSFSMIQCVTTSENVINILKNDRVQSFIAGIATNEIINYINTLQAQIGYANEKEKEELTYISNRIESMRYFVTFANAYNIMNTNDKKILRFIMTGLGILTSKLIKGKDSPSVVAYLFNDFLRVLYRISHAIKANQIY